MEAIQPKKALLVLNIDKRHKESKAAEEIMLNRLKGRFGHNCPFAKDAYGIYGGGQKKNFALDEFRKTVESNMASFDGNRLALDIRIHPGLFSSNLLNVKVHNNDKCLAIIFGERISKYFAGWEPRLNFRYQAMYGDNPLKLSKSRAIELSIRYPATLGAQKISEIVEKIGNAAADAVAEFLKLEKPKETLQPRRYTVIASSADYINAKVY
ncbi:Uncharacterised protein [uncultured archaeon]|nr:Uncharacterised protein [uncultured archaeon]